jgi:hypothetical protein
MTETKFRIGQRVRLTQNALDYPIRPIPAGELGTVTTIDKDMIGVTFDRIFPDLHEWNNEAQFMSAESGNDDAIGCTLQEYAARYIEPI